jgi:hypothetical protein
MIAQTMTEYDFGRFDDPIYPPDIAACDLFLFNSLHVKISRSVYGTV